MNHKLPNYLRTYRKRAGLTQDEVAHLLGYRSGTRICRYEQFRRLPSLRTALAFEVIFRTRVRELFAGVFEEVKRDTKNRARRLSRRSAGPSGGKSPGLLRPQRGTRRA